MGRRSRTITAVLTLAAVTGCSGPADKVILEPLFGDNMVLQQKRDVPVWGKASPGGKVTVSLAGQSLTVRAGRDSTWRMTFAPLKASVDPVPFTVAGRETTTVKNVVVGEVWLASGQSNMEWTVWNATTQKGAVNGAEEVKNAEYPLIRHIKIGKTALPAPTRHINSDGWKVCSPENAGGFSAVGYFFARDLHQDLGVPVGVIGSNWGGTAIQPWISGSSLAMLPDYAPRVAAVGTLAVFAPAESRDSFRAKMDAWLKKINAEDPGYVDQWYEPGTPEDGWKKVAVPGLWKEHYDDIAKLDGIAWYRTTFSVPASWAGKPATLHMGAVDDQDVTWINGTQVGTHDVWNAPRKYGVPAGVLKAGENVLAVRVKDELYAGGFWGERDAYYIERNGSKVGVAGTWTTKMAYDFNAMPNKPPKRSRNPQGQVTALYNGMIAPLVPYAIRGAIWYQGESNAGNGMAYRTLMPLLISDWRARWGIGDFPFYLVQLANYMKRQVEPVETRSWAELREAQLLTVQNVPHTGMAVITDIGEADDIHPRNKQDVGKRLALVARNKTYGEKELVYSGPVFKQAVFDGDKVALLFDHVHDGLTTFDGKPLTGFAVAGADSQFVWGNASIEENRVVVGSRHVKDIKAVRYAWANNPIGNLANKNGLPASPFRTDVE